jgi:hypothetical protein
VAVVMQAVGVCAVCGEDARLRLDRGRRSVVCGCGVRVAEAVFAACGFGNAAAVGWVRRRAWARQREGSGFSEARYAAQVAYAGQRLPPDDDERLL